MKKVILFLLVSIIFAGCSPKVHKNISDEMARDTIQILDIMDKAIKENRALTEQELKIFEQYEIYYGGKYDYPNLAVDPLTEEEKRLYLTIDLLVKHPERFYGLESYIEDYKKIKKHVYDVMEDGILGKAE